MIKISIILGYFDPKAYFPSINLSSLDDTTFDDKIKEMLKIPDQNEKRLWIVIINFMRKNSMISS